MNERIIELADEAVENISSGPWNISDEFCIKFAQLIVRECIDKIETHQIPVGNSAAGEMACEMTYSALMEIRDEIREHFGVEL